MREIFHKSDRPVTNPAASGQVKANLHFSLDIAYHDVPGFKEVKKEAPEDECPGASLST
jgi:hypothetical protein